jgi:hypothetical protein
MANVTIYSSTMDPMGYICRYMWNKDAGSLTILLVMSNSIWLKQNDVGAWTNKKERSDAAQTSLVACKKNTSLRDPSVSKYWQKQCEGSALLAHTFVADSSQGTWFRAANFVPKARYWQQTEAASFQKTSSHCSAPGVWIASSGHWQRGLCTFFAQARPAIKRLKYHHGAMLR